MIFTATCNRDMYVCGRNIFVEICSWAQYIRQNTAITELKPVDDLLSLTASQTRDNYYNPRCDACQGLTTNYAQFFYCTTSHRYHVIFYPSGYFNRWIFFPKYNYYILRHDILPHYSVKRLYYTLYCAFAPSRSRV